MSDIQDSFTKTIKNTTLSDVAIDLTELSIDNLIDNDVIKQIPIVKTFVGIVSAGISMHDRLFLKKILGFLNEINDIDEGTRSKIISKIDMSKEYRIKVGEKLLYIIDSCEDYEHSGNASKLFREVLNNTISYDEFLEAASIVAILSSNELRLFLDSYNVWYMSDGANELTHTGLVYFETEEVEVDLKKITQDDYDDPEEHYEADVSGGETTIKSTAAGDTVFEVFGIGREARLAQIKDESERRKREVREKLSR